MQTPVEIAYQNMEPSDHLDMEIRDKTGRLEKFFDGITSCHVFVEAPPEKPRRDNHYQVRIELRVPGTELVVTRSPGDVTKHDAPEIAVRDAFGAMEKKLKKWKEQRKGDVKHHEGPLQGRVVELHPDRDFGQIAAADGRLVYFHRNAVIGTGFEALEAGDPVELDIPPKEGDKGPQASTVRLIGEQDYRSARG